MSNLKGKFDCTASREDYFNAVAIAVCAFKEERSRKDPSTLTGRKEIAGHKGRDSEGTPRRELAGVTLKQVSMALQCRPGAKRGVEWEGGGQEVTCQDQPGSNGEAESRWVPMGFGGVGVRKVRWEVEDTASPRLQHRFFVRLKKSNLFGVI